MRCPTCCGTGCAWCEDGQIRLTSCARDQVTPDTWDMLRWVFRYRDHGVLPEDGNGLSQTQCFMEALDVVGRECDDWDVKLGVVRGR